MSLTSFMATVLSAHSGSPRDTMSLDVAGGAAINGGNADVVNNGSPSSPKDDRRGAQPAYTGHFGDTANGSHDGAHAHAHPPTPPRLRAARERRDRLTAGSFYGPQAGTNPAASSGLWHNKDDNRLPQPAQAAAAGSSSRSESVFELLKLDKDDKNNSAATAMTKTTSGDPSALAPGPSGPNNGRSASAAATTTTTGRDSQPPSPDSRPPSPGIEGEENVIRASSALARMASSTSLASATSGSPRRSGSLLSAVGLGRAASLVPRSSVSAASRHLAVPSAPLAGRLSCHSSSSTLVGSSHSSSTAVGGSRPPSLKLAALASPFDMGPRALARRDSWDSSDDDSDSDDGSLYFVYNDNPMRTPVWVPIASVMPQRQPPVATVGPMVDVDERIRQINAEMDLVDQSRTPVDAASPYGDELGALGAGAGVAPGAFETSTAEASRPGMYKGKAKRTTADSLASLAREKETGGHSGKRTGSIASMASILELPQVQQALFEGCRANGDLGDVASKFENAVPLPDHSSAPAPSAGPLNASSPLDHWLGNAGLQGHFPSLCARFKAQAMKNKSQSQSQSQAPAEAQAQQQASIVSTSASPAPTPSNVPAVQGTSRSPPPPLDLPAIDQPAGDAGETEGPDGLGSGDTGSDGGNNDAGTVEPSTQAARAAEEPAGDVGKTATSDAASEAPGESGEVDTREDQPQVADVADSRGGGSKYVREAWYARYKGDNDDDNRDGAAKGDAEANTETVADAEGPSDPSPGVTSVADESRGNGGDFDFRLSQAFSSALIAKDPLHRLESAHARYLYLCRAIAYAEALLHKGRDAFSKACVPLSVSREIGARYEAYEANIAELRSRAEEWRKAGVVFEGKIPLHRRLGIRSIKRKAAKLAAEIPEAVVASMAGPLWSDVSGAPTYIFGRRSTVFRAKVWDGAPDAVDMIACEVLEGGEWVPMGASELGDWIAWN